MIPNAIARTHPVHSCEIPRFTLPSIRRNTMGLLFVTMLNRRLVRKTKCPENFEFDG